MDSKKTGLLIKQLREKLGLTQAQLAEKLSISDKAVCKWETGNGFPEVSQLLTLSEILGVTVDELLKGGVEKKAEAPSLYESACGLSDIKAIKELLSGKNLREKDINGNTFLDCVVRNRQHKLL